MLKDILLKTCEIINRDDIISALNSQTPTTNLTIQNDILRLISYYNYVIETLSENYFNITNKETLTSDNNKKISYYNFTLEPHKIVSVKQDERTVLFCEYSTYILVPNSKTAYEVEYKFIPEPVTNLDDKTIIPHGINKQIIYYGIASEFFASKSQFDKAEYWKNKYMYEIFKTKVSKNRKMKATFVI